MTTALLIDFGSTYTKLRAVDVGAQRILGAGQGPSTVTTDIMFGMRAALDDLERRLGKLPRFDYRLASSSAAGGLRMVTVGLVRELTAEAARRAALGAGAKLVGAFAYRLTTADIAAIHALAPDIVLLAGGTDGGNSEVVIANAQRLAATDLTCPIVYAGNRAAADEALAALAGKTVVVTDNVMPEFNVLAIEPTRAAIRQVFIDRIVHAKGIDRAAAEFDAVLMPTPAAVLEGARLVADGITGRDGLGTIVVVDPGGATTDVHSIAAGDPAPGVVPQGLPEPRVKRTVEGDLGMRHNVGAIVEAAGIDAIAAEARLTHERVQTLVAAISRDVERLPASEDEHALDRALVRAAVRFAVERHCGTIETVYTVTGPVTVQRGKDLTRVDAVIGTGGAIVASREPRAVLEVALADAAQPLVLKPRAPRLLLDSHYILYACGLLAAVEPRAALDLALAHLHPLEKENAHERACCA
ncbi:MAG TPA: methylaspartate mutase accessory protein GlmL [Burkholderiales bacterium]|nr:methylaspartate mutase accessory protein GlmL [Burkholderiales bacterium]